MTAKSSFTSHLFTAITGEFCPTNDQHKRIIDNLNELYDSIYRDGQIDGLHKSHMISIQHENDNRELGKKDPKDKVFYQKTETAISIGKDIKEIMEML